MMDQIVEDKDVLFTDVFRHLDQVSTQSSNTVLDEDLLKRAERALDASVPRNLLWRILRTGEELLQHLNQDPRPLTRLLERTVLLIPFDELKATISAQKLIEGLSSPSIPVQLLCLAYLRKASDIPSGASFVACSPELVKTLVTVWLASESTEVSERALEDIVALLAVDSPGTVTMMASQGEIGEAEGQGLMWRRIFHDPSVYSLLFGWTSLSKSNHDLSDKKGQQAVTISQARLFDFISQVASLDWPAVTSSKLSDVEQQYYRRPETEQPYGGILKYAANGMVDEQDYLMEVLRQDFFMKLLRVIEDDHPTGVSPRAVKAIQDGAGVSQTESGSNGMHL